MGRITLIFLLTIVLAIPAWGRDAAPEEAAVSDLVAELSSPENETRAQAAAEIRRILAENPDARTNDHGRKYWEERAAQVKPGMKHSEVVKLLPPYDTDLSEEDLLWTGEGTGEMHVSRWRLDHYWVVTVWYQNPDTVHQEPELTNTAMDVWVEPPKGCSGTWVTYHVNGEKSREIEYRDGEFHGLFRAHYDNGQKMVEQHYRSGIASGTDAGWHKSGSRMYEGRYENGKREGIWTHWYEDGKTKMREDLDGGELNGVQAWWHPNGQIQYEVHYRDGKKHGLDRAWEEWGTPLWTREYRDGEFFASPPTGWKVHTIEQGDTLTSICDRYYGHHSRDVLGLIREANPGIAGLRPSLRELLIPPLSEDLRRGGD